MFTLVFISVQLWFSVADPAKGGGGGATLRVISRDRRGHFKDLNMFYQNQGVGGGGQVGPGSTSSNPKYLLLAAKYQMY